MYKNGLPGHENGLPGHRTGVCRSGPGPVSGTKRPGFGTIRARFGARLGRVGPQAELLRACSNSWERIGDLSRHEADRGPTKALKAFTPTAPSCRRPSATKTLKPFGVFWSASTGYAAFSVTVCQVRQECSPGTLGPGYRPGPCR